MQLKTVPVADLMDNDPHLAMLICDRYGMPRDEAAKLHALFLEDVPNDLSNETHRCVTMAMLVDKPMKFDAVALGTTIKNPFDIDRLDVGGTVSLTRAIRRLT